MPKAEGGEPTRLSKSVRLPILRGGQTIKYFDKAPNASGAWIHKLDHGLDPPI